MSHPKVSPRVQADNISRNYRALSLKVLSSEVLTFRTNLPL